MSSTVNRLMASASQLTYPKENPNMKTLADSLRRQNKMLQNEVEELALAVDQMAAIINVQNARLKEAGLEEVAHKAPDEGVIDLNGESDGENGDDP